MTRKDELVALIGRLEDTVIKIDRLSFQLDKLKHQRIDLNKDYQSTVELATQEWLDQTQQTWCTQCRGIINTAHVHLIRIDETFRTDRGDCYGYTHEVHLEAVCSTCYQKCQNRNGWYGRYDEYYKFQPQFHCQDVETRDDDKLYLSGSVLDDPHPHSAPPSTDAIIEFLSQHNLPPAEFSYCGGRLIFFDAKGLVLK